MRDAQVRRVSVVNDVGRLVASISIDDLVLKAQNVGAGADAASVVRFHAVGRVGQQGRGIRQPVQVPRRGRSSFVAALVASGVRRAGTNATRRLVDARSSAVESLPPAGGRRPVGGRPRADSAGSSESLNLCAEPGQLQVLDTLDGGNLPATREQLSAIVGRALLRSLSSRSCQSVGERRNARVSRSPSTTRCCGRLASSKPIACACAHRRQGALLRSAPASRG